ncbi:MAG: divergent PAP2 family protein, partial [Clostridiales bacterium]|nr:divergent PAP2 family protein [Clostridiales bacterium]
MWFRDLISNQFLLTGISSWLWAQVLKTIIH